MRLSDVLSRPPAILYEQVESFMGDRKTPIGKSKKLSVGKVALNFRCNRCGDTRTFLSGEELYCIPINEHLVSIDCGLRCTACDASIPMWYLVDSDDAIYQSYPKVRIIKRTAKFSDAVSPDTSIYKDFSILLDKAERAYQDELGAGAIVYLRKILESITFQVATKEGVELKKKNGSMRPFKQVLEEVDAKRHIVPNEYSQNGYRLFGELSDVVHGDYDEEMGLKKYSSLRRLVVGILDNVKNSEELLEAAASLGFTEEVTE